MKLLTSALVIILALATPSLSQADTCRGCRELKAMREKFEKEISKKSNKEQWAYVDKIRDKITELPHGADGSLTKPQIKVLVEILRTIKDENFRLDLLEQNEPLLRDNRDMFAEVLKPIPGPDAVQILRDIDSLILTAKYGQDAPKEELEKLGPPPPHPKSAKEKLAPPAPSK